jgi:outer membrane protein insertion porin family
MVVKLFSGLNFVCFSKILLLVAFCGQVTAATPSESAYEKTLITDIRIGVNDSYGSQEQWIEMVRSITTPYIKKGDLFSGEAVNRLTTALKSCRRFRLIHLDTETTQTGLALLITTTPFKRIKNIRINGKYPLFEKQILNAMTLYPGDAYVPDEVGRQSELIAELYRRHGYIDPKVEITTTKTPDGSAYYLDVVIEKGRPYRLTRFEIEGNQAFQGGRLRWKMKSVRSTNSHFSEKRFLEDIETLKRFYKAQGFADIVVEHQLDQDPQTGDVEIRIMVDEGDRYDIFFVGNTAFGDRALKKKLDLFKSGNRHGTGLRRSVRNITEKYHQAGYAEVVVNVETAVSKEEGISIRRVNFIIDEGPQSIVRRIVIRGNTVFSQEDQLKNQMLTRVPGWLHDGEYVADRLEEDILAIKTRYYENGYMHVNVHKSVNFSADRQDVDIDLDIHEGNQTMVGTMAVEGLTAITGEAVQKAIQSQVDKPFSRSKLKNDERRIGVMVSEKGYPHVQVSGDVTFNEDQTRAHVVYRVRQNRYVERGATFHAGNFRTQEKILDRELIMKPGDPFSLKKMLEGQQNIRSMNIFRSVAFNPVGLKEEAQMIHLFTEVEEEKPFYFEATGGYASEKGLYTTSTIGDRNFLGLNKDFKIGGELGETGYKGESRIFEPRFFGTRISSDLGVSFERNEPFNQTFGTDSLGADLQFSRKWKKKIKTGLGFRFERREQFSREPDLVEDDAFDPRSVLVVTPSVSYDSRDNFMNPKKGAYFLAGVDLSAGLGNALDDFYTYRTDLRGYITPVNRLTFAGRGSMARIKSYNGNGDIPDDELFYLGGTSSVRGFDENLFLIDPDGDPVGGQLMALGNAELRIDMGSSIDFSIFYDIGYLDETSASEDSNNVRYSMGIGLRYVTPVGAVGLTYGHKLNPEADESPGRFHFSIGYTF